MKPLALLLALLLVSGCAGPVTDPTGAETGELRVVRGGDWDHGLESASTWSRRGLDPAAGDAVTGFRVALSLP